MQCGIKVAQKYFSNCARKTNQTAFKGKLIFHRLSHLLEFDIMENLKAEFDKQKQEVERQTDALVDAAKKDIQKAIGETQAKINESMNKYTESAMSALDDVKVRTQQTLEETKRKIDEAIDKAKENK